MDYPGRRSSKIVDSSKFFGILLSLAIFLVLINSQSGLAQQGGISIGQTVMVTAGEGLRLRSDPSTSADVITKLPYGTLMKVIGGPEAADNYTWWELEGEPGRGWAAEKYLKVSEETIPPTSSASNENPNREESYPGIQYIPLKNRTIHVLLIDLNDPHIRFETVMANKAKSVNTSEREFVQNMGERLKDAGAVAVINADYFGDSIPIHGPEGFTVIKGNRLDGPNNNDYDGGVATLRSSLVFSRSLLDGGSSPLVAKILRLETDDYVPDPEEIYFAVGGGPQIIFDGSWDWTRHRNQPNYSHYLECPDDYLDIDVINGECFRGTWDDKTMGWENPDKLWTVVGKTNDGHLLMLVAPYSNIKSTLESYQVQEAIKLDGGASSQLWYDGQLLVKGGRDVANGLAVFYKNAYDVTEQPSQFPVVISGESLEVRVTLKNTGANTWLPGNYVLRSTKNPWNSDLEFELPKWISPNEEWAWEWQSPPVENSWGIYQFELQLVERTEDGQEIEFPTDPIRIRIIVIPESLADKKEELERKIQEWIDQGIENLEQQIVDWIERQLRDWGKWLEDQIYLLIYQCCLAPFSAVPLTAIIIHRRHHSKYRKSKSRDK